MKGIAKWTSALALLVAVMLASGCSIKHQVVKDYPQYLQNNQGADLGRTDAAHQYALTPSLAGHHYEFRSAMVGYAHVWVVEVGEMLKETMATPDVQHAFSGIAPGTDDSKGLLRIDLNSYTFDGFGAHLSLGVSYLDNGRTVFAKTYRSDGATQGAKMFWGGPFAMKNAIQQSTKGAVDSIVRQLVADLDAQNASSNARKAD